MALPLDDHFVHRANRDGTTDSICRYCFATVCTSNWETDLSEAERRHFCDPSVVARMKRAAGSVPGKDADGRSGTGTAGRSS